MLHHNTPKHIQRHSRACGDTLKCILQPTHTSTQKHTHTHNQVCNATHRHNVKHTWHVKHKKFMLQYAQVYTHRNTHIHRDATNIPSNTHIHTCSETPTYLPRDTHKHYTRNRCTCTQRLAGVQAIHTEAHGHKHTMKNM